MRRLLLVLLLGAFVVSGITACKPGLLPTENAGNPKVTLDRVEVMSYFPWTDLPARTPLALGFLFNVENPSGYNIKLDNIKFTVSFAAAPDKYIEIATPTYYDQIYFPPKTTSQYRIVSVIDSVTVRLTLLVAQAPKVQELKLNPNDLIKDWYAKVGDFAFGIKVSEGMAVFSTEKGDVFVPFEGKFPKK
ncbi:MAG: hypothetical protein A2170_12895 [Deltaproteobacteria bacterium RBG_13_53_10]|nr:MAG: hypothetical protein A2170_12895 [Deltaproteobacteria bacterium RBG_13_53_10]